MDYYQFVTFIITFIITFFALIASMIGMFWWNRSSIDANALETRTLLKAIQDEIKDFHGRLCVLEERSRK